MRVRQYLFACLFLVLPALAQAQQPAAPPPPPPQQEGSGEFSLVDTTGNASTQSLGLGAEYFARPEDWEFHAKAAYVRNKSEDVLTAQSLSLLFRGARTLSPRLSAFGEYDFLRDHFAGIDARHQLLGGLAYKVVDEAPQTLIVDASLGYANEQRLLPPALSTAIWNAGLNYRAKLSASAEFTRRRRVQSVALGRHRLARPEHRRGDGQDHDGAVIESVQYDPLRARAGARLQDDRFDHRGGAGGEAAEPMISTHCANARMKPARNSRVCSLVS